MTFGLLFLTLFSPFSSAEDICPNIYSASSWNDALEKGLIKRPHHFDQYLPPIRDQDSIGHCASYAAADSFQHWLKKRKLMPEDKNISATGAALQHYLASGIWKKTEDRIKDKALKGSHFREAVIQLKNEYQKEQEVLDHLNREYKSLLDHNVEHMRLMSAIQNNFNGSGQLLAKLNFQLEQLKHKLNLEPPFKNLKKKIIKSEKKVADSLHRLNFLYASIRPSFKSNEKGGMIPEGALTEKVIENLGERFCYDSEISDDLTMAMDYQKYKDLTALYNDVYDFLGDDHFHTGFGQILGDIIYETHYSRKTKEHSPCYPYLITKTLFPHLPINSPSEYSAFIRQIGEKSMIIPFFINASCPQRSLKIKPQMETLYSKESKALEAHIDKGLKKGELVTIGFLSTILEAADEEAFKSVPFDNHHAALIIGTTQYCQKKFYTLRNSWGEESCQAHVDNFSFNKAPSINENYRQCLLEYSIGSSEFLNKKEEECRKKRFLDIQKKREHLPFFCDEQGNFIIESEYLLKGSYSAGFIKN
jgi:hypothetical protein